MSTVNGNGFDKMKKLRGENPILHEVVNLGGVNPVTVVMLIKSLCLSINTLHPSISIGPYCVKKIT
jgi:hypothetical protein